MPREVLILEPDAEGHSQEWLQHLAEFVAADATAPAISVVAPATLCTALSRSMPAVADGRIRFIALKPREPIVIVMRLDGADATRVLPSRATPIPNAL